ncbi:hypothetical protein MPC1_6360002 [Methylocella tundrae]|nr:hypothetical protein MPC1_6360002 [Methylocella tundrae]
MGADGETGEAAAAGDVGPAAVGVPGARAKSAWAGQQNVRKISAIAALLRICASIASGSMSPRGANGAMNIEA